MLVSFFLFISSLILKTTNFISSLILKTTNFCVQLNYL